jgi:type IV secretion system protein VirD4
MANQSLPYKAPTAGGSTELAVVAIAIVSLTGIFSLAVATEHVAAMLGYSAVLGAPLMTLRPVGPVYAPWDFILWVWKWRDVVAARPVFQSGVRIFEYPTLIVGLAAMIVVGLTRRGRSHTDDLHGSAHWASRREIKATGLLDTGDGVYVGAWRSGRKVHYLRDEGPAHVLAFAPTRTGKGVGLVVPTLLSWPHSVVVHDIKGENWTLTAGWRQQGLGSLCLRFDPTCTDGTAARYNPLSEIRLGAQEVKDAQNIADMLVDPAGNTPRDHWDLTGHDLLTGVILHVIHTGSQKTLAGCLNFLNPPDRDQEKALRAMIETPHAGEIADAVIAGAAQAVLSKSPNERASVISVATRCLALFRDPIINANTCKSDFSISDLMHHERPVSLYLTVPPSDLTRTRALMRLFLAQMGARLTEKLHGENDPSNRRRLLLMLDEFPALGRLDFLQNVLAYAAGYGIKAYLIAQDLSQLYAAYGRDESIVSNCAVRVAFTPNKIETARLLSEMAGIATVRHQHRTRSASQVSVSEPESQRPLLTADEAMRLPGNAALIFVSGSPAIYGTKIRYYSDAEFSQRAKIAAPRFSDRIEHEDSFADSPDARTPDQVPEPAQTAATVQSPDGSRDSEKSIAREVQTNGATAIDGDEKTMSERLLQ